MGSVVRFGALRAVIYPDDHDPPHVHVFGDGETKIALGDSPDALKVIFSIGAKRNEQRRAVQLVKDNHAKLLDFWNRLHGRD